MGQAGGSLVSDPTSPVHKKTTHHLHIRSPSLDMFALDFCSSEGADTHFSSFFTVETLSGRVLMGQAGGSLVSDPTFPVHKQTTHHPHIESAFLDKFALGFCSSEAQRPIVG